jgi:Tfp pilus assembly protein PilN
MRIDINLASQKYEDVGEFYLLWGGALSVLLAITAALTLLAWHSHKTEIRETRNIRELRDKITRLDEKRRQAEAALNRPENQDVRDQSRFWNDVIDEKAFSWTQLFSDLEKILPTKVYITSAQPSITKDKRLKLKLVFVGEKFDDANELLNKMERSERFRLPELSATGVHKPQGQANFGVGRGFAPAETIDGYQFEISTYYTPTAPSPAQPRAEKKGA